MQSTLPNVFVAHSPPVPVPAVPPTYVPMPWTNGTRWVSGSVLYSMAWCVCSNLLQAGVNVAVPTVAQDLRARLDQILGNPLLRRRRPSNLARLLARRRLSVEVADEPNVMGCTISLGGDQEALATAMSEVDAGYVAVYQLPRRPARWAPTKEDGGIQLDVDRWWPVFGGLLVYGTPAVMFYTLFPNGPTQGCVVTGLTAEFESESFANIEEVRTWLCSRANARKPTILDDGKRLRVRTIVLDPPHTRGSLLWSGADQVSTWMEHGAGCGIIDP